MTDRDGSGLSRPQASGDASLHPEAGGWRKWWSSYRLEVFLASMAVLLLEISYTRVISFKLFYYYTYLVIGLALLGLGTGGVAVAISKRLRRASTDSVIIGSAIGGAVCVVVGYVVVAYISINTLTIWLYTASSVRDVLLLVLTCLAVFAAFVGPGIVLATVFSRAPQRMSGLYFSDLIGAGIGCAIVIFLNTQLGPPATIMLAGALFVVAALRVALRRHSRWLPAVAVALGVLVLFAAVPGLLPDQRLDQSKVVFFTESDQYSAWSPIFRIDVVQANADTKNLFHDGILGSVMLRWNGQYSFLKRYDFNQDPRSIPFAVLGPPPANEAVIGAAAGHEVLASLWFHAQHIDAVELNPATVNLVKTVDANFDGHLAQNPHVDYMAGDGRSFMARTSKHFNLVWYPAPDSYAATNMSTASAAVLSESYLYTTNAVVQMLQHLEPHGIFVAQFGELDFAHSPYRTTRFVATARQALSELGVPDPKDHIMVATSNTNFLGVISLSTIVISRNALTPAQVGRFVTGVHRVPGSSVVYAPGVRVGPSPVNTVVTSSPSQLSSFYSSYKYNVTPTTDNDPYFWHFARWGTVLSDFFNPIHDVDREYMVGERVLLLLLAISIVIAALFLFLPFVSVRDRWRRMPRKGRSAVFFAALGFGFIFYEITLVQLLSLFLGNPTYALTVTLMALLVSTGLGALWSGRLQGRRTLVPALLIAIAALTAFYLWGLTPMTNSLMTLGTFERVLVSIAVLAPLGVCLGMFLPMGVGAVARLGDSPREYVAWSWAVNGFASVTGSVLATILSMAFGFHVVLAIGLCAYVVAMLAWMALTRRPPPELAEPVVAAEQVQLESSVP